MDRIMTIKQKYFTKACLWESPCEVEGTYTRESTPLSSSITVEEKIYDTFTGIYDQFGAEIHVSRERIIGFHRNSS